MESEQKEKAGEVMRFGAEVSLYLVAGPAQAPEGEFLARVEAALDAGVDLVQFREKAGDPAELVDLGERTRTLCRRRGRPFVVNDDPRLARLLDADGLHLGQEDMAPRHARAIVGESMAIGLSTHSVEQARLAFADPAVDLVGVGPIFATMTKDAGAPLGPELWSAVAQLPGARPGWAIGGITAENLPRLVAAGCRRIAVSSAILQAPDAARAVEQLLGLLRS